MRYMLSQPAKRRKGSRKSDKAGVLVRLPAKTRELLDKAREVTRYPLSIYVELALEDRFEKDGIR